MMRVGRRLVFGLCFVLGSDAVAAQLGGEITGDSPRMASMAGAGLAGAEDLAEAAHNPAMLGFTLTQAGGWGLDFSLRGIANPIIGTDRNGRRFAASDFTAVAPFLAVGNRPSSKWAWSLQLLPTAGGSSRFGRLTKLDIAADETAPGSGEFIPRDRWIEVESEVVQLAIEPSFAWTPAPGLSFGLGASFRNTDLTLGSATEFGLDRLNGEPPPPLNGLAGTWGEFLKTLGALGGRDLSQFQVEYDTEAEADLMRFLKLGFAYEDDRGRRFGIWFRPPSSSVDINGHADIDLEADLGDIIRATFGPDASAQSRYDLRIADIRFPAQIGFAYFHPIRLRDRVHFQAIYTKWSQTFNGWTAELSNGSNEDFNSMLGGNGDTTIDLDNHWDDAVSVSFGWEHDWIWVPGPWERRQLAENGRVTKGWEVTSRLGVGWSSDPVGGAVVPGLLPSNHWHLGSGLSFHHGPGGGDWHLGAVVAIPQNIRTEENSVLSDFSYDVYRQTNYALVLGYSLRW